MNWLIRGKTYIIFIGLVFLSALFSCEDPSRLGIDLIDEDDDLGVLFTEIPIEAKVVLLDSVNTTGRGIMMTGSYNDSDFGNLEVQSYVRIVPPTTSPDIPESVLEADSVRMKLRFNYFFGQSPSTHHLVVHELSEQLDPDTTYYSFNSNPFNPASVIDSTFMVSQEDTLMNLDLESIKDEIFQALKDYEADSAGSASFLEQFNGFTFISEQTSNAVLGFSSTHSESQITLYYTTNDTVVNTVGLRYSTYYNQITPDYTGTELEGIQPLTDFSPASGRTYLQTGTGLVPKINFQPYFDFIDNDTTGTIVINKAQLVMENLQGVSSTIDPPLQMSFYFTDNNNQIIIVGTDDLELPATIQTDQIYISTTRNNLDPFNANARSVRAELDTASVKYQPEISLFLQLVADGILARNNVADVFSIPFSFVEIPSSIRDNGRNVDRFIIEPGALKLEIFYTRLR